MRKNNPHSFAFVEVCSRVPKKRVNVERSQTHTNFILKQNKLQVPTSCVNNILFRKRIITTKKIFRELKLQL